MLRQILALTWKDLKVMFKDPGGIGGLFLMPAMFILIMSAALAGLMDTGNGQINVLVVNEDTGSIGADLVASLRAGSGITIESEWEGAALTRAKAEELITARTRNIAILIPAGLTQSVEATVLGTSADPAGASAEIELMSDPATPDQVLGPVKGALFGLGQQAATKGLLEQSLDKLFDQLGQNGLPIPDAVRQQFKQGMLQSIAAGDSGASLIGIHETQPANVKVEKRPNTVQQSVPGWTLFGVFFIAQALALSFLDEKKGGSFSRLVIAPMSRTTIMLGKLIPDLIVNLIQIVLMFAVGVLILPLIGMPRLELGAHPEGLVLISLCASLAANGLGLLLAAMAKTREQIVSLSGLLIIAMAALGGVMVPRFMMPEFMQTLGLISPHSWALIAYQDILVRGYTVADILPQLAVLLGFAAVFFAIALWRFKWD